MSKKSKQAKLCKQYKKYKKAGVVVACLELVSNLAKGKVECYEEALDKARVEETDAYNDWLDNEES